MKRIVSLLKWSEIYNLITELNIIFYTLKILVQSKRKLAIANFRDENVYCFFGNPKK